MKRDWIIHYVSNSAPCIKCKGEENPARYSLFGFANIHTHGLDAHGQREICIALDIGGELASKLLNSIGDRVALKGEVFTEGVYVDILQGELKVEFVSFKDDPTLYLMLPDPNGYLPGDCKCSAPYSLQKEYAELISINKDYV